MEKNHQACGGRSRIIGSVVNEYGFKIDRICVKGGAPRRHASKYPIVLHHGFGGFDSVLGLDYFFKVKHHLESHGFEVYVTEVTALGTLQTRADQLAAQIDQILAKSSAENGVPVTKINLIGHSMGGIDPRLVISTNTTGSTSSDDPRDSVVGHDAGGTFATLTTVAAPHWGSIIADMVVGDVPGPALDLVDFFMNFMGGLYNDTQPDENEVIDATYYLTEKFMAQFALDHPEPQHRGIIYRTYAGVTHDPLPVLPDSDEVDAFFLATYPLFMDLPDPEKRANDGFVARWSAKWKDAYYRQYRGDELIADHYNQVGQVLGLTDPDFDHLDFYLSLANQIAADNETQ